jgi:hypothetical protein
MAGSYFLLEEYARLIGRAEGMVTMRTWISDAGGK